MAAAAVAAVGLGCAWLVPTASAAVRHCGAVTIPVRVTKTLPMTYGDTTARGVSCGYVDVFLIDISRADSAAPPTGWTIRVAAAPGGVVEDICTRGREAITFRVVRQS